MSSEGETRGARERPSTSLGTNGPVDRREILTGGLAIAVLGAAPALATVKDKSMYGLIGRMIAQPGKRDELIAILLEGTGAMPGCLSYIVARDVKDENAIWVTEVWDSKDSHTRSLKLPAVQAAIGRGRPLIAGFDSHSETEPVGGVGIA